LTCWILVGLLYIVYLFIYTCFIGSPAGEADKTRSLFKKITYVRRAGVAGWDCHVAFIFIGEPTNILQTWQLVGHGPTWLMFIDHAPPTNIRYVRWSRRTCVLMFSLCSSAINIYSSVFGRQIFPIFYSINGCQDHIRTSFCIFYM
jgi:hypothetical protein